ncbi:MAG: hypothetical protein HYX77_02035 [Acidobacteria bacterium]|nr:hypothetical protein [Acidobacteriota bacterium]
MTCLHGCNYPWSCPVPFEVLADLVSRLSDLVHAEHTDVLTTLGGARVYIQPLGMDDAAMGLDLRQVHSDPDIRHPEREAMMQFAARHSELVNPRAPTKSG